ncbi:MAG: nickel pincer cofactor biosynthesis protein LarB [candidate division Zixibacteria bacterium]|nr:nickel pincer cofactor biosynthesis protein LarB [candidate division Zixibacteria bacterium]
MNQDILRSIIEQIRLGTLDVDQALGKLKNFPTDDLSFAKLDTHRQIRTGQPEAVFCPGKSPDQLVEIARRIHFSGTDAILTRIEKLQIETLKNAIPEVVEYGQARMAILFQNSDKSPLLSDSGQIAVLTAGVADMAVAEEAALTSWALGAAVERIYDIGVAGIHRLKSAQPALEKSDVIIVVAGMEGALVSVVGGLVDKPVIGVPTSAGYGVAFGGVTALLGMLNSCASGVTVVNIDNGFGAGSAAVRMARLSLKQAQAPDSTGSKEEPEIELTSVNEDQV